MTLRKQTLIECGEKGTVTLQVRGHNFNTLIQNSTFITMANAGHIPHMRGSHFQK